MKILTAEDSPVTRRLMEKTLQGWGHEVVSAQGGTAAWARPLLESIRGRTYSTGEEATYRLERYTMTARLETATGSHLLRPSPQARVEYLDLTIAEAPPPSPPETRPN